MCLLINQSIKILHRFNSGQYLYLKFISQSLAGHHTLWLAPSTLMGNEKVNAKLRPIPLPNEVYKMTRGQPMTRLYVICMVPPVRMQMFINLLVKYRFEYVSSSTPLIARFMGPTWGPSGADRTQVGHMLSQELCYLGHAKSFCKFCEVAEYQEGYLFAQQICDQCCI